MILFILLLLLYSALFSISEDSNHFADFLVQISFLTGHGFMFFGHFIFEGNNWISSTFNFLSEESFILTVGLSVLVVYILLGALIGLIIGKIKSK